MKQKELVKIEHRERETCVAIFLRYVENGKRVQKSTGLFYSKKPKTAQEISEKKNALKEAEAIKSLIVQRLIEGRAVIKSVKHEQILLVDKIREYGEGCRAGNTKASYNNLLKKIEDYAPDADISQLDKGWFVSFVAWMKGKGLKDSSIKLYFDMLNAVMKKAVRDGLISKSCIDDMDIREKPKTAKNKREYLTKDEFVKMIEYEQHTPMQKEIMRAFAFACYTGLRYSDVRAICWENIIKDNGKYYFEVRQQKTKEIVRAGLSSKAYELIAEHEGEKGNVFCLANIAYADYTISKTAKAVGIEKSVSFHIARHTFAVNLLGGGVDLYSVSKLLGHSSVKTTEIYADMMRHKMDDAVSVIDKML